MINCDKRISNWKAKLVHFIFSKFFKKFNLFHEFNYHKQVIGAKCNSNITFVISFSFFLFLFFNLQNRSVWLLNDWDMQVLRVSFLFRYEIPFPLWTSVSPHSFVSVATSFHPFVRDSWLGTSVASNDFGVHRDRSFKEIGKQPTTLYHRPKFQWITAFI